MMQRQIVASLPYLYTISLFRINATLFYVTIFWAGCWALFIGWLGMSGAQFQLDQFQKDNFSYKASKKQEWL